jgi:uncharacterized protein (TIGR02271 family)
MASETIVAVFDTAAHAEAAIADLRAAGIPDSAIEQHSGTAGYEMASAPVAEDEPRHTGFWAWLTGEGADESHHALYDRSIAGGSTVVTVVTDESQASKVSAILESHGPVDLDERHDSYGLQTGSAVGTANEVDYATPPLATGATNEIDRGTEEVIALAEEQLDVGKREVSRGTTRVRRYVVERPVEEQITLRNERVSVYRRPISGTGAVGPDAFTDKTVELTETSEEAVVAKTARVVEEVVVGKTVEDRVEKVRDTVRREEVEIEGPGSTTPREKIVSR